MEEKKKPGVGFGVMMLKDGKVLLGKRHEDPTKTVFKETGTWTMPGGKLDYQEDLYEGAKREVKEETDIELKNCKVICINNDMNEHAHFITIGLLAVHEKGDFEGWAKVMEPDEIVEWKWFGTNELPEKIYFPSAHVLDNYKQKEFYIKRG